MIDFEQKFLESLKDLEKFGDSYANDKAQSWYMQEMRKVILANQMKSAEAKTLQEKENIARTSEEYLTHLEGTRVAIYNEQKAKSLYDKAYAKYEALRSLSSQQTASMRLGG